MATCNIKQKETLHQVSICRISAAYLLKDYDWLLSIIRLEFALSITNPHSLIININAQQEKK